MEPAHEHTTASEVKKEEYYSHFMPHGYAIAGCELGAEGIAHLLSFVQLTPSDRFVDLGSATGRLTLAAAALTSAHSSLGVELSPSRHSQAVEALKRTGEAELQSRVSLQQADLLEANLHNASVVWCAVRPSSGRRIGSAIVAKLRKGLPRGQTARLFLAGFPLPCTVSGATLRGAYLFGVAQEAIVRRPVRHHERAEWAEFVSRQGGDPASDERIPIAQLYGGQMGGPSVVIEYGIDALEEAEAASA